MCQTDDKTNDFNIDEHVTELTDEYIAEGKAFLKECIEKNKKWCITNDVYDPQLNPTGINNRDVWE